LNFTGKLEAVNEAGNAQGLRKWEHEGMTTTVLVVDDEASIRQMLCDYLRADGFDVTGVGDGKSALLHLTTTPVDTVLLDLSMPGMSGLDVLAEIRRAHTTTVIVVTARGDETDKVLGLSLGADDYVTKPFSPREIAARIRAVLRRGSISPLAETSTEHLRFGTIDIDVDAHEVHVDANLVDVTAREFEVLLMLARSPGKVLTRRVLLERVWGNDFYGDERIVDVHIRNLRRTLRDDANHPKLIATVRGVGYKFVGHL
jgi:DNA-binding response OmpR family regulator